MSADVHDWPLSRRLTSPFAVLLYVYGAYFALTYSRIYEYVYWELMNLGTRIIGFHPSTQTLVLYIYGGLCLAFGAVGGALVGERVFARVRAARERGATMPQLLAGAGEFLARLPIVRSLGLGFTVSLLGWGIGMVANAAQVAASGTISLTDIASRWAQSPVLVFIAASQIFFVPALIVSAKNRWTRTFAVLAFIVSVLALGLLGARNLPAKLVVSSFLAAVYVIKPAHLWKLVAAAVVLLVLAMGVVGAITKAGIYGPSATAGLAVALTYSDSVGTAYNLDRIVRLTPSDGIYRGKLLYDSSRAAIPGVSAEYANYQLGRYLGGRSYFVIGETLIDRSVSLAPTLLGAPYADWGVLGVVLQMTLLGAVFGYLQMRSRRVMWVVPFLVTMASYVINGVNAGVHNPHAIIAVGIALFVTVADAMLAPYAPALLDSSDGN